MRKIINYESFSIQTLRHSIQTSFCATVLPLEVIALITAVQRLGCKQSLVMNAKSNTAIIFLCYITASQYQLYSLGSGSQYGFHRTACRKDVLFKLSDRGKKLTGGANNIIMQRRETTLSSCVKKCLEKDNCITINYKKPNEGSAEIENCQLLNILKANGVMVESTGWNHYEPVKQVLSSKNGNILINKHSFLQLQLSAQVHSLIDVYIKWFTRRIYRANSKMEEKTISILANENSSYLQLQYSQTS